MEYIVLAIVSFITLMLGFIFGIVMSKPVNYTNAGSLIIDQNKTYGVEMYLEASLDPEEIVKNKKILLNVVNIKSH